jgi:hypothetical protein
MKLPERKHDAGYDHHNQIAPDLGATSFAGVLLDLAWRRSATGPHALRAVKGLDGILAVLAGFYHHANSRILAADMNPLIISSTSAGVTRVFATTNS